MSKVLIVQLVFVAVLVISVMVLGVEIIGPGHMNPDVIIPWGYVAFGSWVGGMLCVVIRCCDRFRKGKDNK